jgi:PadR family transcriptional regulator AphA
LHNRYAKHPILDFLNDRSYTCYELKKIFDSSVGHFWPADPSQIYRTLTHLTENGWAEMEKKPQEDRPDRKVYHVTEAGRKELLKWIAGPPAMVESRIAPLIQVFFNSQLSHEEILAKFEGFAEAMRAVLNHYEQVPEQIVPLREVITSPREQFFWLLTLENGICHILANRAWATSVIERIKNSEVPTEYGD